MANQIRYITQLSKNDIVKILAAANVKAGRGINIQMVGDQLEVSLDVNVIVDIVWCFVRQGMVREGLSGRECVVKYNAKNTRTNVITDPNRFD